MVVHHESRTFGQRATSRVEGAPSPVPPQPKAFDIRQHLDIRRSVTALISTVVRFASTIRVRSQPPASPESPKPRCSDYRTGRRKDAHLSTVSPLTSEGAS